MRRSNRNFNIAPSPGQTPGISLFSVPGGGELDLCLGGVGKIEPEVSGFKFFASIYRKISAWLVELAVFDA